VELFNYEKQAVEDVPDESISAAVAAGTHGLPKGAEVPVIAPDGTRGTIAAEEAHKAFSSGFQFETAAQREEFAKQEEYGEGLAPVRAAVEGVARGGSFGLSDLLLSKFDAEGVRERKERNPVAAIGSEVAGAALLNPLGKLGLGAKLAGKLGKGADTAAKTLGAAPAAVSKAALAVEKGVEGVVGSSLLGRATSKAVGMALEAEVYNLAHNLSEAALEDKEITAERLLANSGEALAIGAGLGFGLPVAGKVASTTLAKAKDAVNALGRTLRDNVLAPATQAYAERFAAKTGTELEVVNKLVSKPFQAEAAAVRKEAVGKVVSYEEREKLLKDMVQHLDDVDRGVKAAKLTIDTNRAEEVGKLLANVDATPALEGFAGLHTKIRETAQRMLDEPLLYDQAVAKSLAKVADDIERKAQSVGFDTAEQVFHSANTLKQSAISDLARFSKPIENMSQAELNAVKEVRDVYKAFASHLEDATLYGEAAARQAGINEAYSTYLRTTGKKGDFRRYFLKSKGVNGLEIDPEKVNRYMNRTGSTRDEAMQEALNEYQSAVSKLLEQADKTAQTVGVKYDKAGMVAMLERVAKTQAKAAEDLAFVSKVRAQDAFGMAFLNFQKAMGGVPLVGQPAAQVAELMAKAASPIGIAKTLSTIEGVAMDTGKRVTKAVGGFIDKSGRAAARAGKPALIPLSTRVLSDRPIARAEGERRKKDEPKLATFKREYAKVSSIVADPATAATKLDEGFTALGEHAPQLRSVLVQKQLEAAQFLYDKAPKNPAAALSLNPLIDDWQPSDAELAKWERYNAAVQDPISVVEEMQQGIVSREGVEVLRTLYPKLYGEVQQEFATRISELQTKLPYVQRLNLSVLLDMPVDPSTTPQFVAAMQNAHGQAIQEEKQQQQGLRTSANVDFATPTQTQAQRIANK
jgi:hypothetical protein